MMRKSNFAKVLLILCIGVLVVSACGPAATATPAATSAPKPTEKAGGPTSIPETIDFSKGFASKDPTTFVMLEFGGVDTLDSALAYDSASGEVLQQTYDTLIFYNRENTSELVPMLATEVPSAANGGISTDGLTYTFRIRKGVLFHNGDEMKPSDVAFTFQRGILQGGTRSPQWLLAEPILGSTSNNDVTDQLDPDGSKGILDDRDALAAEDPAELAAVCEKVKDAIVADDQAGTVTFKLAQSWGPFLVTLAGYWAGIQEQSWVAASGGWDGDCGTWQNYYAPSPDEQNEKAIGKGENGTGPYKLKEWGDQEIILESNEDYWVTEPLWQGGPTGAPAIKTVILKYIDEFSTRFAAFQAGDADGILPGSPENWAQLDTLVGATCDTNGACNIDDAANPAVRYVKQLSSARTDAFLVMNINTEGGNTFIGSGKLDGNGIPPDFFSDVHVRRAFAYCFDWDTYITDVQQGEGTQATNVMLRGEIGDDPMGAKYSYDPIKCEEEFKASTLTSEDGQSLWDTGFRMTITYNSGNQMRQSITQIWQSNIAEVNPKFVIETSAIEWSDYLDAVFSSKMPMFVIAWGEDIPDPHNWTFTYTLGAYGHFQRFPQDLIDQFEPLVMDGVHESDPVKRAAIYKDFNQLFYEQVPTILLSQMGQRYYFQRWVNGYFTNPLYSLFYYYTLSKN
jgi:peptide/nickel transport system substrate-binding protein